MKFRKNKGGTYVYESEDFAIDFAPEARKGGETALILKLKSGKELFINLWGDHRKEMTAEARKYEPEFVLNAMVCYAREHS